MRIAVFHNFMDNIGGAEIVTLILARELDADIYTTNIDAEKIAKMGFESVIPRIHSIGRIPKSAPFRHQLALWKFRRLDLGKKYDFYIISGDWAMSGVVNNKPNLWYVHSPLNELWQFKDYIRENLLSSWKKPLYDMWVWMNRKLTLRYAKHVEHWVCNSQNTKDRIRKFYGKDAEVIHPPIDTAIYKNEKSKDYWLSVNRLVKHKRIEIQMEAFAMLPGERLIVIGSYEKGAKQFEEYKKFIEKIRPGNIEIRNWVSDSELKKLYAECKGFIATAHDEDFGMTLVEAMAAGKPVIAGNEGGYRETITGKTGILIDKIDSKKLADAIAGMSAALEKNPDFYRTECIEQARYFDTSAFIGKVREMIQLPQ